MIYFNNDIKKINYQGYDITKVYTCGGELVWNADVSYKFIANYSGGESYSAACDSSTTLFKGEVRPNEQKTSAITSAVIGECVTNLGNLVFGGFADGSYCYNLSSVTIPNSVTTIGDGAFTNCSGLTSIELPSGVITIGQAAFYGCSSLTSVAIPSGVTSINGYAFSGCTSLTSITVNATTPPTLSIGWEFDNTNNCPIYVPCASVDVYKAASGWSTYASRIEAIPNSCPPPLAKLVAYTSGETFTVPCDSSTTLTLSDVYDNIERSKRGAVTSVTIGSCSEVLAESSLGKFTNLSSVYVPSTVKTINGAFYGDVNFTLTSVTMSEGLEEIIGNSFKECRGLTEIIVPNSVTKVYASAFSMGQISSSETSENRPKLSKIVLGSGVTTILSSGSLGDGFFGSGGSLGALAENLTVLSTTPPTVSSLEAFSARNTSNFKIYVPNESLNAYKTAPVWGEMASKIYPLS